LLLRCSFLGEKHILRSGQVLTIIPTRRCRRSWEAVKQLLCATLPATLLRSVLLETSDG
jgi:hypothetical protein